MLKYIFLYLIVFSSILCLAQSDSTNDFVINFGSCNKQDKVQPLWDDIISNKPDLWIWLGDNIYGDTDNMEVLKQKYKQQGNNEDYLKLKRKVKVIGTWDDHDFGVNDGNKNYGYKEDSKQLFFDFFDEPEDSFLRENDGVYTAHIFSINEKHSIKVILLDVRYNQDEIIRINGIYQPNYKGDILGQNQWEWFEKELEKNNSSVTIICSGLQIIPADHKDEKWANFPISRQRIFNLLEKYKTPGVIFLSGDRHMAEISKIKLKDLDYEIYEITSSGMTHSWEFLKEDYNRYRIGSIIPHLNYGQLELVQQDNMIIAKLSINGDKGIRYWSETLRFPVVN
ncbi:alkaline phosphatase D family protein [Aestuariivivens sediminis]|uniref:alkaline phosphatase D family protein n=1 Tax=Aestuariivivens sediminis TaxID=2913557 RepID=UPI001F597A64|nr:alkaline phosphatase D family protein [Aestuariivivens sediminis]